MLTRKLLSMIDNIVVDVFKIICCSESTDSFIVNVTVAQLPWHSRGTRFYSRGPCPGWPPLGAATGSAALVVVQCLLGVCHVCVSCRNGGVTMECE